ncbi:hypothetical protein GUJ93_ZPchr0001g32353 [Zizania palustris]|uniref:Uncharacterized protein n=1 Tax=Zizania palustris TaxID=103762 RepID=A0A8J5RUH4_ZIZPA|nr:hypothetical protein GUJ93_ZPchr0001g32353 [Zizania palustris]
MVRRFLEDGIGGGGVMGAEKAVHGGRRCNCFHGGGSSDNDDDEEDTAASLDVTETIKLETFCSFAFLSLARQWPRHDTQRTDLPSCLAAAYRASSTVPRSRNAISWPMCAPT